MWLSGFSWRARGSQAKLSLSPPFALAAAELCSTIENVVAGIKSAEKSVALLEFSVLHRLHFWSFLYCNTIGIDAKSFSKSLRKISFEARQIIAHAHRMITRNFHPWHISSASGEALWITFWMRSRQLMYHSIRHQTWLEIDTTKSTLQN